MTPEQVQKSIFDWYLDGIKKDKLVAIEKDKTYWLSKDK